MVTKDPQTLNLKFDQVMFNSLVFTWERNFEEKSKVSFSHENEAVKRDLVEFKVQCLKVFRYHGNKSTILLSNSNFRSTPEVSTYVYFQCN